MPTDWKTLAKETVHSFDADEVRGMWDVDFRRATRVFLGDHEDEIARETRRWKKALRKTNAIVLGLAKRLAPPRRLVFALALLLTLLAFVESLRGESFSAQASWAFFALFVSILALAFLLAMELVDKLHFKDELVMARELQAELVPRVLPELGAFELGAFNRIANTVGGDLYAFPLGIKKNVEYVPVTTTLASSEVLLFHSDGLSEARGANGEESGDARIEHILFRRAGARPHEVVSALAADLDLFLGRVAAEDDVSIAAVRRKSA